MDICTVAASSTCARNAELKAAGVQTDRNATRPLLFYREQMVYHSEQFVIFQNFKGRVSTQVDVKTGKLIRTTYIGEPFEPKYQILFGFALIFPRHYKFGCYEVPYDN